MNHAYRLGSVVLLTLAIVLGGCGEQGADKTAAGGENSSAQEPASTASSSTLYVKAAGMVKKLGIT